MNDIGRSAFGGIMTHFADLTSGVYPLLFCYLSVMVYASQGLCNLASTYDGGVFSELMATGRDQIGTMRPSMDVIRLTNLSMKKVPISNRTLKVFTTTK